MTRIHYCAACKNEKTGKKTRLAVPHTCGNKQDYEQNRPVKMFAIGIPTLNRMDLLQIALQKYLVDFPGISIFVLDNGPQTKPVQHPDIIYLPFVKTSVASSWNYLCRTIYEAGHQYAAILNDDIILGFDTSHLERIINANPQKFITTIVDWCAFILPQPVFEKIGPFDEFFSPAYYEDKDYERRMRLAAVPIIRSPLLAPLVYRSGSTAEKDSSVHVHAHENKRYYINKWGGPPGAEKFSVPGGNKSKK